MTTTDDREVSHVDIVTLTAFMADHDYTAEQIAYAVEKPWKHLDILARAQQGEGPHLTYCRCE